MTNDLHVPEFKHRPRHVAMIMDGNGRWARERGLPRIEGHRRGADVVRDVTTFARELELRCLTLFSFSAQNWRRPPQEVGGLMLLLEDYCERELSTLMDNDIRLSVIGTLGRFPASTRRSVHRAMNQTDQNRSMTLTLALDYGGREEMIAATQRLARDVAAGRLDPADVDEEAISSRLDTAGLPDPDLIIRTSGEHRISNFLLFQLAYAELHFTDVRWPDFARSDFVNALWEFARRDRRYGGVDDADHEGLTAATSIVEAVTEAQRVRHQGHTLALAMEKGTGTC